jgi:plastocyanin
MQRRLLTLIACALLALGLAACSSSSKSSKDSSSGTAQITIKDLTFTSAPVKAGSTVTVRNDDGFTHTVTTDGPGDFNLSVNGGATGTFTAPSTPGTYPFHCNIHSQMKATLTVT